MGAKKVILFIVEGISDQTSLALILSRLIQNENVKFHIVGCDITSDKFTKVENAIKKVNDQVKLFLSINFFERKHILKIIHLVDTDGAFVNDDFIKESAIDGFGYSPECITARNIEDVKERNNKKSGILSKLSTCSKIGGIPYYMYYFSCNLEHVLHNVCDMDDDMKMKFAEKFSERFYTREEDFIKFIKDDNFAVPGDYRETWEFIKKDNNSLKRYCNFHLFFNDVQLNVNSV